MSKINNKLITAAVCIALGAMLIMMKGGVISLALTVTGAAVILTSIFDFRAKRTAAGAMKMVAGAGIIICGWLFVSLALNLLAGIFIIGGILNFIRIWKKSEPVPDGISKVLAYLEAGASILFGVLLLFNQSGSIAWLFFIGGCVLIAEGVFALARGLNERLSKN